MKLERRTVKGSKVRKDGLTPGILYGKGIESVSVQVSQSEFQKVYNKKGTSKTFEATLEGKKTYRLYQANSSFRRKLPC
jgi:large subunit ribosomal protein L25